MASIRILIADDHEVFAEGLSALFREYADFQVIGIATHGRDAIRIAADEQPDVLLMDVTMPDMNGIEATRRLRSRYPNVAVIGLSMHRDVAFAVSMLDAGARGYLLKECSSDELVRAVRAAATGQTFLTPAVTAQVIQALQEETDPAGRPLTRLTERERDVLQLIAEGHTSRDIAERLSISAKTVSTHREHLMNKLDIHSVADLTRFAVREGLVAP